MTRTVGEWRHRGRYERPRRRRATVKRDNRSRAPPDWIKPRPSPAVGPYRIHIFDERPRVRGAIPRRRRTLLPILGAKYFRNNRLSGGRHRIGPKRVTRNRGSMPKARFVARSRHPNLTRVIHPFLSSRSEAVAIMAWSTGLRNPVARVISTAHIQVGLDCQPIPTTALQWYGARAASEPCR
jgi:hypothetical protein